MSDKGEAGPVDDSRAHVDYLETIFADAYKLHIDHSENVWRTLPFFSATVAFEMTAVVNITPKLLLATGLLGVITPILLAAFVVSIGVMVLFLFLSIKKRQFSYIAPSEEIRGYAQWYVEQHRAEPSFTYRAVKYEIQDHLLEQWAAAGDAIRAVNDKRAQHRERAGRGLLTSIIVILALISVSVIPTIRSDLSGNSRHVSSPAPAGAKIPPGPAGGSTKPVRPVQPSGVSQDEGSHDWVDLP